MRRRSQERSSLPISSPWLLLRQTQRSFFLQALFCGCSWLLLLLLRKASSFDNCARTNEVALAERGTKTALQRPLEPDVDSLWVCFTHSLSGHLSLSRPSSSLALSCAPVREREQEGRGERTPSSSEHSYRCVPCDVSSGIGVLSYAMLDVWTELRRLGRTVFWLCWCGGQPDRARDKRVIHLKY